MWMTKPPYNDFAERFKSILDHSPLKGMKKKDIAKRLEISAPMVTMLSKGERLPAMDLACRIAEETGYCVEYVLTGRGPKHPGCLEGDDELTRILASMTAEAKQHVIRAIHALGDKIARYDPD